MRCSSVDTVLDEAVAAVAIRLMTVDDCEPALACLGQMLICQKRAMNGTCSTGQLEENGKAKQWRRNSRTVAVQRCSVAYKMKAQCRISECSDATKTSASVP